MDAPAEGDKETTRGDEPKQRRGAEHCLVVVARRSQTFFCLFWVARFSPVYFFSPDMASRMASSGLLAMCAAAAAMPSDNQQHRHSAG